MLSGLLYWYGKELDLVLFVVQIFGAEVPYFPVTILDLPATLCDQAHSLRTEGDLLTEGSHLMVASLVDGFIAFLLLTDNVVLEFTHGVELKATGDFTEGLGCTAEDLVGS